MWSQHSPLPFLQGFLLGVVFGLSVPLQAQAPSFRVEGLATTESGQPLADARVVAIVGFSVIAERVTDRLGTFVLEIDGNLADLDDEVLVQAMAPGFVSSAPVHVTPHKDARVLLELRALSVAPPASEPSQILGRVRDEAGQPVPDVLVAVDGRLAATSGGAGGFDIPLPTGGRTLLSFEHVGFERVERPVSLLAGEGAFLDVVLPTRAVELPEITVTAIPKRGLADVRALRHRIRSGIGDFTTAEELEVRGFPSMESFLRGLPGLRIMPGGVPAFRDAFSLGQGYCAPTFWVDGVKMSSWQNVMDLASFDIELIEAYKSAAGMPPEYIDSDSRCGAIVIWSRRGSALPLSAIIDALEGRPGSGR